jgi:anaerobic magnesium-protoporphyrin IX monomethyl ester cyclase
MTKQLRRPRALRPALPAESVQSIGGAAKAATRRRVLMVDLNIFASFPTYAVGLMVAALRQEGHEVEVICPLAHDVPPFEREKRETLVDHLKRRVHLSTWRPFEAARNAARDLRGWARDRPHPTVLREVRRALERKPDIVLLSAYLQHFNTVREIGQIAQASGTPVLLGGAMFNLPSVSEEWRSLPGLVAVVGAEADLNVSALMEAACDGGDLTAFAGVTLPDGRRGRPAGSLRGLDRIPVPDYADFPWDRYPVKIVPLMTGRGCQWDKCAFCSDVVSASGRGFRTRSVENVLLEIQEQARRHETTSFVFLDLKLNSYPDMIRGVAAEIQSYVQGAEWVGAVHVDLRKDNGLSRQDLKTAVAGGMRRVSFGLESGSQRMLDLMNKGSNVERNSEFIADAHAAGLSIRCTMFKGFPGETAADMEATATFLEKHASRLDRVRFNEFTLIEDPPIYKAPLAPLGETPLEVTRILTRNARAEYRNTETGSRDYRRAKARALQAVYEINRREIRSTARQFDGLM